jgi:hypothetical protein
VILAFEGRARKCPRAVPTGLRIEFVDFHFPTLKRGANIRCASGASARTLSIPYSISGLLEHGDEEAVGRNGAG